MHSRISTWARLALAVSCAFGAALAHADGPPVSIQFSIGAPPPPAPMVAYPPPLAVAPSMVWVPEIGLYVALGANQPIFYLGGVYYYNYGGYWYTGPSYGGPWRRGGPPRQLGRFDDRDWGRYQDLARRHHDEPRGRYFRPGPVEQHDRGGPPAYDQHDRGGPPAYDQHDRGRHEGQRGRGRDDN